MEKKRMNWSVKDEMTSRSNSKPRDSEAMNRIVAEQWKEILERHPWEMFRQIPCELGPRQSVELIANYARDKEGCTLHWLVPCGAVIVEHPTGVMIELREYWYANDLRQADDDHNRRDREVVRQTIIEVGKHVASRLCFGYEVVKRNEWEG